MTTSTPAVPGRPGLLGALVVLCVNFCTGLVQHVVASLIGAVHAVEGEASPEAETALAKLLHLLGTLPIGSVVTRELEGFSVLVKGAGLPRHGGGTSLLDALTEATGVPSIIQPAIAAEPVEFSEVIPLHEGQIAPPEPVLSQADQILADIEAAKITTI